MAHDTDTAEIITITATELRWLTFAVRNLQTRTAGETSARHEVITRFEVAIEENPRLESFAMAFDPWQVLMLLWAVQEGRCRDGDERLIRGRLQERFEHCNRGDSSL